MSKYVRDLIRSDMQKSSPNENTESILKEILLAVRDTNIAKQHVDLDQTESSSLTEEGQNVINKLF
ncbi:hypothetical protein [Jeotgalibacillus sp. JSM ZJ347]|uniref:hypothetical protein n=1 Tax=Jeotgalibacillus sp. JSM ZJ347 TaxID=3342117 RepID=UPI0035A91A59